MRTLIVALLLTVACAGCARWTYELRVKIEREDGVAMEERYRYESRWQPPFWPESWIGVMREGQ